MDISDWLHGLGLGQFADAFRENEIDATILPNLTIDDLREMGVGTVGARRKIMAAIAALTNAAPADAEARPQQDATAALAERRQLTVLFCDLVGSTALSARLDPEDVQRVIGPYHALTQRIVESHNGFVAKFMGDGVLAYFGYPEAHEDDAEHAVRAGLALVDEAQTLVTAGGEPLHVRVGVATGVVVVGEIVGSGQGRRRDAVGDTLNLAARLQAAAAPDSVVIAEATRRLVGELFELEELGALDLKGIADNPNAYRALRAYDIESRFEALRGNRLTKLVGRGAELETLRQCWRSARAGEGRTVLLTGEAGIGKSRLTAAFMEEIAEEPHAQLRLYCSPQHTDSTFYPIIRQIQRAAGFSAEDAAPARLDKLDAFLAQRGGRSEDSLFFAEMLSLANDGRYAPRESGPAERRTALLRALAHLFEAHTRRAPAIIVFEDVHWADPSTLDALGQLAQRIAGMPALLVVTARPGFAWPWSKPAIHTLALRRLSSEEIDAMVEAVLGGRSLPLALRRDLVERADGVPLFAEEIVKAAVEATSESEQAQFLASVPPASLTVPPTLHASLLARLDRLGSAKEIAQIGAAIGREFSFGLLRDVAGLNERQLRAALARLIDAELLYPQGAPPDATYVFKHALVQDAAYGTLLREPRSALHGRIAAAMERRFPDIAQTQPELLARHCAEAGLAAKAALLWGLAGQRSRARSALVEAESQISRALKLVETLPESPELRRGRIMLQVGLIFPLMHLRGFVAPQTRDAVARAQKLIEEAASLGETLADPLVLLAVRYAAWTVRNVDYHRDESFARANELLDYAKKVDTPLAIIVGYKAVGETQAHAGNPAQAKIHLDRAIELYQPQMHAPLVERFGFDHGLYALSLRSCVLGCIGDFDGARRDLDRARRDSRAFEHPVSYATCTAMGWLWKALFEERDADADADFARLTALPGDKSTAYFSAVVLMFAGCYFSSAGESARAIQLLQRGLELYGTTGATLGLPVYLSFLARALCDAGRLDEAHEICGQAVAASDRAGERAWDSHLWMSAGAVHEARGEREAALRSYRRAAEIAHDQGAAYFELQSLTCVARMTPDDVEVRHAAEALCLKLHGAAGMPAFARAKAMLSAAAG